VSFVLVFAVIAVFSRSARLGIRSLGLMVGLLLLVPWLMGPLLIKLTQWNSANPEIEEFDPFADDCPDAVVESVPKVETSMADLGFRSRGHFRVSGAVPNGEAFVTVFENSKEKQTAQLFTMVVSSGPASQTSTVIGFTSEFSDGTKLATSNSKVMSLMPRVRMRDGSASFPEIRGPRRLYEIHQACLVHYCGDALRVEPVMKDPSEFLRRSIHDDTAKFAETGYYYFDEAHERYRPTWIGACLMTWKSLWPSSAIRRAIRRRTTKRMLEELGLDR
jgi:hypothetical protein